MHVHMQASLFLCVCGCVCACICVHMLSNLIIDLKLVNARHTMKHLCMPTICKTTTQCTQMQSVEPACGHTKYA